MQHSNDDHTKSLKWRYTFTTDPHHPGHRSNTRLLRNRGAANPGFFEDVTEKAGINFEITSEQKLRRACGISPAVNGQVRKRGLVDAYSVVTVVKAT